MSLNYLLPSGTGATSPIILGDRISISTPELIAGYTSPILNGVVINMLIDVSDNNITWTLNPKVFRFFWDTTFANNVNMNVPNAYQQNFKQSFTPDGISGGIAGAIFNNTYQSFFTIQANPALVGVSVTVYYIYWNI